MSKLQKWCPNYTAPLLNPAAVSPGSRGTPRVFLPLGAQFLCSHQKSLREYPVITPRYWSFLPACLLQGRGVQKLCGMRTPVCYVAKTQTTTATAHQNPDKISRKRRDSDTHTTGPTLTTVTPAIEG